jgi:hypothetical protein
VFQRLRVDARGRVEVLQRGAENFGKDVNRCANKTGIDFKICDLRDGLQRCTEIPGMDAERCVATLNPCAEQPAKSVAAKSSAGGSFKDAMMKFGSSIKKMPSLSDDCAARELIIKDCAKIPGATVQKCTWHYWDHIGVTIQKMNDTPGNRIKGAFQKAGSAIKGGFEKFGNDAKNGLEKFGNDAKNGLEKAGSEIKGGFEKAGSEIKKGAEIVGNGIKKGLNAACEGVKTVATGTVSGVMTAAEHTLEGLRQAMAGVLNAVTAALNSFDIALTVSGQLSMNSFEFGVAAKVRLGSWTFDFQISVNFSADALKSMVRELFASIKKFLLQKIPGLDKLIG